MSACFVSQKKGYVHGPQKYILKEKERCYQVFILPRILSFNDPKFTVSLARVIFASDQSRCFHHTPNEEREGYVPKGTS